MKVAGGLIGIIIASSIAMISPAHSWELIHNPNGYSTMATLAMRMNDGLRVGLNIDFDTRQGCRPGIGILEFRGARLGAPTSRGRQAGSMRVSVGGTFETVTPYLAQYDNGVERMQFFSRSLITRISQGGGPIQVQIDGRRTYEFPIDRDTAAIRTAEQACLRGL